MPLSRGFMVSGSRTGSTGRERSVRGALRTGPGSCFEILRGKVPAMKIPRLIRTGLAAGALALLLGACASTSSTGFLETPYTADQIRGGNPEGTELVFRQRAGTDAPWRIQLLRFASTDATGAVVEKYVTDEAGDLIEDAVQDLLLDQFERVLGSLDEAVTATAFGDPVVLVVLQVRSFVAPRPGESAQLLRAEIEPAGEFDRRGDSW